MDENIPTPLTDAVYCHDHDSDRIKNVALRNHAESLERQLTISRRSCAVLQAQLEKERLELNERLAERTRAYEEKDRKAMRLLSRSCNEHWKTSVVMLRMKALLEDVEAAGRPHSRYCECPCCEAWQAAYDYLHTLSPAPATAGRDPETPPPQSAGLTCSGPAVEGNQ